jgi:transcriptional regulator with GAF, ATPase, and Fis domain
MVKEGLFREDLWYRINVFPISIPPLRQRRSDIPALVHYFKLKKAKQLKLETIPDLEPGSIDVLTDYDWPGNVRELENVIERALILNKEKLNFSNLKKKNAAEESIVHSHEKNKIVNLDEMTKYHILDVLKMTEGKIHGEKGAARLLGINASTLRNRMNKLSIDYKKR